MVGCLSTCTSFADEQLLHGTCAQHLECLTTPRTDNWNSTDPSRALEWVGRWLRSHMQASRDLNKPLLLGEVRW